MPSLYPSAHGKANVVWVRSLVQMSWTHITFHSDKGTQKAGMHMAEVDTTLQVAAIRPHFLYGQRDITTPFLKEGYTIRFH